MSSDEEAVVVVWLVRRRLKTATRVEYGVHPCFKKSSELGSSVNYARWTFILRDDVVKFVLLE
jgi:hypothetical protein